MIDDVLRLYLFNDAWLHGEWILIFYGSAFVNDTNNSILATIHYWTEEHFARIN